MKVTIILNREEVKHLDMNHTFYDCCGVTAQVMKKIQKAIAKGGKI